MVTVLACENKTEFDKVDPIKAPTEGTKTGEVKPDSAPKEAAKVPAASPQMVKYSDISEYGKTGPLRWVAPEGWTANKPASTMRLAEYTITGADGAEPATVTVFYFGRGQGGDVGMNVDRWVGQFTTAEGGSAKESAKRDVKTIDGMKVHTVDASGTYNAGMAGGNQPPKPNQRMLGAIVETEVGRYFFKLVGPKEGVDAQASNFEAFLNSFKKGS